MGIKLTNFQIFIWGFFVFFFCSCFNFSFCKLSLVGTLKATPRSWWKAIQNAHFLPASGLWSKRRENKRAVEMEEYEGSKERTKKLPLDTTWISSTCLGSQQTCKWEWHIWHWCKEAQLQIKYIMGNFIQSSRSRPPFGFLLQNHHSQSVGMKKCLQDLEFVGLLLLDTSVFCLAWLDVEVTHERYRSTLGKFGQPAETKNVERRTSRKSKAPCQQQAAMNIDCSNFLCSSLAPKTWKSTCPPCMSSLIDILESYQKVGWTCTKWPNKQGIWYVPTLNVFVVPRIFSLANTASLKPELRQIGDTKWILLWSPMYARK